MKLPADPPEAMKEALGELRRGGVIAHATETCYGLACDLTNREAVEKLFAIKRRPKTQAVSALFASVDEAKQYVEWPDTAEELARKFLPGPLTMILKIRTDAPHQLFVTPDGGDTIGIRISSHPFTMQLARAYGLPLSTTSANIHGQANPYSMEDLQEQFGPASVQPDLLIDGGTLTEEAPSTIVDLTGREMVIIRRGSLAL